MTTYLQDSVTRANNATDPGTPDVGGPYTVSVGTWGVSTNRLYTSVSNAGAILTFPAAVDVDFSATFTFGTAGSGSGMLFRYIDGSNFWYLGRQANGIGALLRCAGGVFTTVSNTVAYASPVTFRVVAHGRNLYPYVAGQLIGEIDDQWHGVAGTTCGVRIASATNNFIDDLIAVDVPANPSGDWDAGELAPELFTEASRSMDHRLYKGRDTRAADLSEVP